MEQTTINAFIDEHPDWQQQENTLVGEWNVNDFSALRTVITQLCDLTEELNHHPTVTYGYNTLRVATTTHDAGNTITDLDLTLARRVSELLTENK